MKIAVGNSRMDKKWKNRDISWDDLCTKVSTTIRTTETVEEFRKLKKGAQDAIKDVGGFVGGQLRGGRRKNGNVLCRSMLTLDMDYGKPGIWDEIDLLHDFKCCVYSTHKHTPEHPRLRMIIPLAREVTEDEYPAVARMVASEIGIDLFDDTTYSTRPRMAHCWTRTPISPSTPTGMMHPPGRYPHANLKQCAVASRSRLTHFRNRALWEPSAVPIPWRMPSKPTCLTSMHPQP